MPRTLLTSQADHDAAFDRLLVLTTRQLDIFDRDLSRLKLEQPTRLKALKRLLTRPGSRLRIVVQDGRAVPANHPQLMRLLDSHSNHFELIAANEKLADLADSIIVADNTHALIRFHRDQPRGKLLENEEEEVKPYEQRFQSILDEGGTPISPRVAGL